MNNLFNTNELLVLRALHEKDDHPLSRAKFFFIALVCSFLWYVVPGYLFMGVLGALTLDWTAVASFLSSPLISPFFAIANVFVGYALIVYVVIPISYWGLNVYNANRFPIFSSHLFTAQGQKYNISAIVDNHFELNVAEYEKQGRIHLSMFFALTYGFGFATIASTLTHVVCFYGRYIAYRFGFKKFNVIHMMLRHFTVALAWWLLNSIKEICHDDFLPANSPWTCPGDRVFFDASVIWGLVGPKCMFGSQGKYSAMNWFLLGGALGPAISWIPLINLPVLLGATGMMPPATPLKYYAWIFVEKIFNFFIFRYRKKWWQRYNYVLSAQCHA
ncbi:hypothetical protein JHK84_037694 [Glycine max]|nr:hypothetical protein JHK85_038040 [Glycine max]KAG4978005.1 hypothetical protein JHK86_037479 [Glycine max]KAG5131297.1 hypothetical protein JHK84_037694 [Glycine max]